MSETATAEQAADKIEPVAHFGEWAVVEVMGHRFHAGRISEETIAGSGFLKVEALSVSADDGSERWATVFYQPHALFSIRPGTEEQVRREAPKWYPAHPVPSLTPGRYHPADEDDGEDHPADCVCDDCMPF